MKTLPPVLSKIKPADWLEFLRLIKRHSSWLFRREHRAMLVRIAVRLWKGSR